MSVRRSIKLLSLWRLSSVVTMAARFPSKSWPTALPSAVGLDVGKLQAAADYAGGRGCIIRQGKLVFSWGDITQPGDVASAAKPWYAHFLFKAVQDGRVQGLDSLASDFEPRLAALNPDLGHKDRSITFRHLATQTACYGVTECPGEAYVYNDWQMALFVDTLFTKVYRTPLNEIDQRVLHPLLTGPLGCEDQPTLLAFGREDRPGRLAISPRDFARFGWLYLNQGRWLQKHLLAAEWARLAISQPLPLSIPRTAGQPAAMLPDQRTIGSNIIPDNQNDHDGCYSWLWWVNGVRRNGRRRWPGVPIDAAACIGHNNKRGMAILPSLHMVASWNDTQLDTLPSEPDPAGQFLAMICAAGGTHE
ncbi:MAG: hypothetical protein IT443_00630 [Phycisphaeraceae bacterium]|nr:hypothetical protein [Phycisphaeraceae bacterium]